MLRFGPKRNPEMFQGIAAYSGVLGGAGSGDFWKDLVTDSVTIIEKEAMPIKL